MKRFSFLSKLLAASFLVILLTGAASAVSYGTGTVTASSLHLRALPTTASASLTLAYRGSQVEVLADKADGWYEVSFKGLTGYMYADYLKVVPTPVLSEPEVDPDTAVTDEETAETEADAEDKAEAETEESAKPGALGNGKVTLQSGYLNIRSKASMQGGKIGTIPNHTVVGLDAYEDGWYQVTYLGVTGYVAERYIVATDEAISWDEKTQAPSPAKASGESIVALATNYLGKPYRYAASGPDAFDCSGLTSYIYKQFGYSLGRSAADQFLYDGVSVPYSDLQKGDLVFFREFGASAVATHVGLYVGNGQFIHASSSGSNVKYSSLSSSWFSARYVGAKRVL